MLIFMIYNFVLSIPHATKKLEAVPFLFGRFLWPHNVTEAVYQFGLLIISKIL